MAAQLLNLLAPLMSLTKSENQKSRAFKDVLEIVKQAAELDQIFRMSKADFQVFITRLQLPMAQPPKFGFDFDPETMECIKTAPLLSRSRDAPVVDLAVSPDILKAGNSDGAHYNSERLLVKLQALCNLQPTLDLLVGEGEAKQEVDDGQRTTDVWIKQEPGADDDVDMLSLPHH